MQLELTMEEEMAKSENGKWIRLVCVGYIKSVKVLDEFAVCKKMSCAVHHQRSPLSELGSLSKVHTWTSLLQFNRVSFMHSRQNELN